MAAIISEIRYRNGPNFAPDGDFIEIRVPTGDDVSDLTVEVYNNSGSVRSTNLVSDAAMTTVGGFDYYVVSARINRLGAVSLVDDGVVSSFVSFDAQVAATGGAANGTTSTQVGSNGTDDTASLRSRDGENFFVEPNPSPGAPCFTAGTRILTADGEVPVEKLSPGSRVMTADGQIRHVRLVMSRKLERTELLKNPKLRPVRILAGALGGDMPRRDLLVSRQHRMLIRSIIARRMFGTTDVLVAAIRLTVLPGIYTDDAITDVTYYHLVLDRHEVVVAEGAPSESLFTGRAALEAMPQSAREELISLFPDLCQTDIFVEPACYIPSGKHQKKLITRHRINNKALLAEISMP